MNIKQYLNLSTEEEKENKDNKDNKDNENAIEEDIETQNLPLLPKQDDQNLFTFLFKNITQLNEKEYKINIFSKYNNNRNRYIRFLYKRSRTCQIFQRVKRFTSF